MYKSIRKRMMINRIKKSHSVYHTQTRKSVEPIKASDNPTMYLQRTIGNQALQRMVHSRIQRQCTQAAGRILFNLYATGIGSGHSHIRQNSPVEFRNWDNISHTITIVPFGIFTTRQFVIRPNAKVITFTSQTTSETSGSILDNVPRGRSVHDITVCP